jgi:hypothetical protein
MNAPKNYSTDFIAKLVTQTGADEILVRKILDEALKIQPPYPEVENSSIWYDIGYGTHVGQPALDEIWRMTLWQILK